MAPAGGDAGGGDHDAGGVRRGASTDGVADGGGGEEGADGGADGGATGGAAGGADDETIRQLVQQTKEYFRVSGPLASKGTVTTVIDEDDDP